MSVPASGIAQGALAEGLLADDLPSATVQCHAAFLVELADGDLGCAWFGGTQEGMADISIWFSRRPAGGGAWSAPMRLSSDAQRSEQNPVLFRAPDGALWLLHTAQVSGHQDTARIRCRVSRDDGATWGPTRDLCDDAHLYDGGGLFVRQPPVVAPGGQWLLPVFRCRTVAGERWSGDDDDSALLVSSDEGRHWRLCAVPDSLGCVHMNIVRGRDDRTMLAFYRSRWADRIHRSVSHDGGLNWSAPQPTPLPNNNSSIQCVRLASGRLAVVYNHSSAEQATERRVSLYDELEGEDGSAYAQSQGERRRAFWGAPRAPMSIALSDDDGLSWPMRRDLETGDGYCMTNNSADRRNRELSYPSIVQSADGALQVAYTHFRQRIRHLTVSEAWVAQGTAR